MNFQRRIPFTSWRLCWAAWKPRDCYWCVGVHMYPFMPPTEHVTLHFLAFTVLFVKESK